MRRDRDVPDAQPHDDPPDRPAGRVSRRLFLLGSGAGTAAGVGVVAACTTDRPGSGVSGPTSTAPTLRARQFFTPGEAVLVEAATGRILPGTDDDPGAVQAGVVVYIDSLLASGGYGGEPVYRMGPFVTPEDALAPGADIEFGDEGEDDDEEEDVPDLGTSSFGVTRRPIGAFDRYGEQSMLEPPEVYRIGLAAMQRHAVAAHGASFADLPPALQDQVLMDIEDDAAPGFDHPSGPDLFALLRQHTIEGMFSDPMYGGNQDMVGWSLVGWPGAQRGYSPDEMLLDRAPRPPQSMQHLPSFRPGDAGGRTEPVLPQAGSDQHRHDEGARS